MSLESDKLRIEQAKSDSIAALEEAGIVFLGMGVSVSDIPDAIRTASRQKVTIEHIVGTSGGTEYPTKNPKKSKCLVFGSIGAVVRNGNTLIKHDMYYLYNGSNKAIHALGGTQPNIPPSVGIVYEETTIPAFTRGTNTISGLPAMGTDSGNPPGTTERYTHDIWVIDYN